jgi:hypothetical protein
MPEITIEEAVAQERERIRKQLLKAAEFPNIGEMPAEIALRVMAATLLPDANEIFDEVMKERN